MLVTVVIPIAPEHLAISEAAFSSVKSQTIACAVIPNFDAERRGAGWARNHFANHIGTPFLLFLDADDQLRPDAIERMLAAYQQGRYVYCDDQQGDSLHQTPDCGAWQNGTWHSISALIPTVAFKAIGGFDETLPAAEDLDFFLRLQAAGCCGIRCPHPLLSYTPYGQRSKAFTQQPDYRVRKQAISQRWIGAAKMSCGCGAQISGVIPDGKMDTDILVTALYTPRAMIGPISGRQYPRPRGAASYQLWVDPRDAEHPRGKTLWSPVRMIDPAATPAVEDVVRMAAEAMGQ